MSQVKTVKTRIQHKHDIEANWIKAVNFIPLEGELIIYDAETNSTDLTGTGRTTPITYTRFKFGNGTDNVTNLSFNASPVDWDQNDPQARDYIKNRTHYETAEEEILSINDLFNLKTYEPGKETPVLAPIRDGYIFCGWYDNPDFEGEAYWSIPNTWFADITLYARWEEI